MIRETVKVRLPEEVLAMVGKRYPGIWKVVEALWLKREGGLLHTWPSWCFAPVAVWYTALCAQEGGFDADDPEQMTGLNLLSMVGTWRYSQGVFRIDPDVFKALWGTKLAGDIPVEVLLRLPHWCVYVETPGQRFVYDHISGDSTPLHGFWALNEWDVMHHERDIRLLLNTGRTLWPWTLRATGGTLRDLVQSHVEDMCSRTEGLAMLSPREIDAVADSLTPLINLLLYLCLEKPEYDGHEPRPGWPRPRRTKKGPRIFPAAGPKLYTMGGKTGGLIRRYRDTPPGKPTGRRQPPHLRGFHWQGYWTGPRTGARKYKLNWKAPYFVNGEEESNAT